MNLNFRKKYLSLPLALLSALILILLIEIFLIPRLSVFAINPAAVVAKQKKDFILHATEQPDILFMGDSTTTSNIDISAFEQDSHLSAYNLGLFDEVGMIGQYYLLETYLAHKKPPKAIVFTTNFSFWVQAWGEKEQQAVMTFINDPHLIFGFAKTTKSFLFATKTLFHGLLNSLANRFDISRLFRVLPQLDKIKQYKIKNQNMLAELDLKKGQMVWYEVSEQTIAEQLQQDLKDLQELAAVDFSMADVTADYLLKFLSLAKEYQVPVLFQFSPISQSYLNDEKARVFLNNNFSFLTRLADSSPVFFLLHPTYTTSEINEQTTTGNRYHFTETAAAEFTHRITPAILQKLNWLYQEKTNNE